MDKFIKVISSFFTTVERWIIAHPKAATVVCVFIVGFILGLLF